MRNRIVRFMLVAGIILSVLAALPVQTASAGGGGGTNRYVSTTGADSGACTNSLAPCHTITYAIAQSGLTSADLIHIATGTYFEYLIIDRSISLIGVQENLTLIDGGAPVAPTGGGGQTLVVVNSGVTATLQDLNVQHGAHPGGNGGGIYNSGTLSLVHVVVAGNTALIGGGIFNAGGLSLSGVYINDNSATAGTGGGLYTDSTSEITLSDVTLYSNTASGYSGGIHHQGTGGMQLSNVTFSNNTAHIGGAMTVTAVASAAFANSTIISNHKDAVAGSAIGGIADYGTINMVNTILYGNDAVNCGIGGTLTSLGYNIDGGATCLTPAIALASDHPNTNPLLGPLAKNGGYVPTHAPLIGSPAIDTATVDYCPSTDAAGWQRPQDGDGNGSAICDIGALEAPSLATFTSTAAYDGWVLESSESSNLGGTMHSATTTFNVGEDAARKQYRGFVSFNTASLPDAAKITSVRLKINKQATVGTISLAAFHGLLADIRKPYFGTGVGLALGDFQATPNKLSAGTFSAVGLTTWYSAPLVSSALFYINVTGATQFRIRFGLDDNNNAIADYMRFYSGSGPIGSRPQLVVQYYTP